jgi:hypothetical protein
MQPTKTARRGDEAPPSRKDAFLGLDLGLERPKCSQTGYGHRIIICMHVPAHLYTYMYLTTTITTT